MRSPSSFQLKFLVPQASLPPLSAELALRSTTLERTTLSATHLDSADRRLAAAGMSWQLRREGRRWIQILRVRGDLASGALEHAAILPDASPDAAAHAGTLAGERLGDVLDRARADGVDIGARFQVEGRRLTRRMRTGGAVVYAALDDGRLLAGESTRPLREITFRPGLRTAGGPVGAG